MSSRGFCGLGNSVFPSVGAICRTAFVTWAGSGGCCFTAAPHTVQGAEEQKQSSVCFGWVHVLPAWRQRNLLWSQLYLAGPNPCSGSVCTCSAPSLALAAPWWEQVCGECQRNSCFRAFLPARLGLSHHFSSYFSCILFVIKTSSCTWLWEKSICKIYGNFCVMRQVLFSALAYAAAECKDLTATHVVVLWISQDCGVDEWITEAEGLGGCAQGAAAAHCWNGPWQRPVQEYICL